jgi:hypothetical protein
MLDTLETAKSHGLVVRVPGEPERIATDTLAPSDFEGLVAGWHAVTLALNSLSRSMGVKDVYPFVLSSPVLEKLRFIHRVIGERKGLAQSPLKPSGVPSPASSRRGMKACSREPARARPDE